MCKITDQNDFKPDSKIEHELVMKLLSRQISESFGVIEELKIILQDPESSSIKKELGLQKIEWLRKNQYEVLLNYSKLLQFQSYLKYLCDYDPIYRNTDHFN